MNKIFDISELKFNGSFNVVVPNYGCKLLNNLFASCQIAPVIICGFEHK